MMLPVLYHEDAGQLPATLSDELKSAMDEDFQGLGGGGFRVIKARKLDFALIEGKTVIPVPDGSLRAVFVCADNNHHVWYQRKYAVGQEACAPDLIWKPKGPDDYPPEFPMHLRRKVRKENGMEGWDFQIRRRTVWVLMRPDANGQDMLDVDNPYVLDVTSSNIFGDCKAPGMFKLAGLRALCDKMSTPGFIMTPNMFVTRIRIDPAAANVGSIAFQPELRENGYINVLNPDLIYEIVQMRKREDVVQLAQVREKRSLHASVEDPAYDPNVTATADGSVPPQPAPMQPRAYQVPPTVYPAPQAAPAAPLHMPQPQPVQVAQPAPVPPQPQPQPVLMPQPPAPQPAPHPVSQPAPQTGVSGTGSSLLERAAASLGRNPVNQAMSPEGQANPADAVSESAVDALMEQLKN